MVSINESTQMKAIAILMVLAGHILNKFFEFDVQICSILGTGGVAIFLILSGYGVMSSYLNKGITRDYWLNKLKRVMIPYWIVMLIWIFASGLFAKLDISTILLNLLFADLYRNVDGTMWYMSFLMIWYVLFFFVFVFGKREEKPGVKTYFRVSILLAVAVGIVLFGRFGECSWQFERNAFSFPLGVLFAALSYSHKEKLQKMSKWAMALIMALSLAYLVVFYFMKTDNKYLVQIECICVFLFVFMCFKMTKMNLRILYVTGTLSYIIYLVEGDLLTVVAKMKLSSPIASTGIFLAAVFAAVCTYQLGEWLLKRLISVLKKSEKR